VWIRACDCARMGLPAEAREFINGEGMVVMNVSLR
jgi:hypothetical protein